MAKKNIYLTYNQIQEALGDNKPSSVNVSINPGENAQTAIDRTKKELTKNGMSPEGKNVSYVVSETFSKKEILEKRRNVLEENSITFTKKDFLNKK